MDEIEILKRLDFLLLQFKSGKLYGFNQIMNDIQAKYNDFTKEDTIVYLKKLIDDGMIELENSEIQYRLKFEGKIFIGYEKKRILDGENLFKISRTASDERTYKNRLFWATLIAGISACLLLLWQVFLYVYPLQSDFYYFWWQKIP
jgi:hypothetical protein